ncbi:ubiquinol-cytochrome C reductase UQCRX/QCR9-like family protein [Actinidia rufa]|uniref:Complex III subunit 9 n=1 Tax=Actinidia rufa TaxID=165716 RepID=A0A7J0G929_9ERIC|nr:ubiquinol-cytochrome C reductase UQCRX/QCR9-like family protein [Actinidia rufa]
MCPQLICGRLFRQTSYRAAEGEREGAMDSTARRSGGALEGLYRVLMRRTSVYATFVIAGAFLGERVVDYGVHKLWEHNNVGASGYDKYAIQLCLQAHVMLINFKLCSVQPDKK